MYEVLLDTLKNNNCDVAVCDFQGHNPDFSIHSKAVHIKKEEILDTRKALKSIYKKANTTPTSMTMVWNKLYKREVIGDTRFSDLYGEDVKFCFDLYLKDIKTVVIPKILYEAVGTDYSSASRVKSNANKFLFGIIKIYMDMQNIIINNKLEFIDCENHEMMMTLYLRFMNNYQINNEDDKTKYNLIKQEFFDSYFNKTINYKVRYSDYIQYYFPKISLKSIRFTKTIKKRIKSILGINKNK